MRAAKICLMVDDDIDDQEIFSIALKELGVTVDCVFAFDGMEALAMLEKDPSFIPDIIFLDYNMPKMNGKQCLVAIKSNARLSNIPVIFFSTSSQRNLERELKLMGADAYFTKPSSISELTKQLAEFIKPV